MGGGHTTSTMQSNPNVNFAPTATGGGSISIGGSVGTGDVKIGGDASSTGATTDVKADVAVTPVPALMLQQLLASSNLQEQYGLRDLFSRSYLQQQYGLRDLFAKSYLQEQYGKHDKKQAYLLLA